MVDSLRIEHVVIIFKHYIFFKFQTTFHLFIYLPSPFRFAVDKQRVNST